MVNRIGGNLSLHHKPGISGVQINLDNFSARYIQQASAEPLSEEYLNSAAFSSEGEIIGYGRNDGKQVGHLGIG